jgi:class 3 adenylate cyclase/TolB-like protein
LHHEVQGIPAQTESSNAVISNDALWTTFRCATRTLVVLDLVESVRLYELDEEGTLYRWEAFVREVETQVPQSGGRLVKSLGDGLIVEFPAVTPALKCTLAMQSILAKSNVGVRSELRMHARIGVHTADVYFHQHDIYGRGVNLASRLATLAQPGQIVISSTVRDLLVSGLDPEVEHIGACYLKHVAEPVNAYRIQSTMDRQASALSNLSGPFLFPTIGIIPFEGRFVSPPHSVLGELIADATIACLSANGMLRIISRLSTSLLSGRARPLDEISALLGANFIASGSYRMRGDHISLMVELADARNKEVIWANEIQGNLADVLEPKSEMVESICAGIMTAIAAQEMQRAQRLPLPTLEGFSLQLAGSTLMHRSSRQEFDHAREIFEYLIERHPRMPEPRAWLAKWYVLRVTRGLVEDLAAESGRALEQTRRALDASPECSLALAVEGFVHCHMLRDLGGAEERLNRALAVNPNDSLAWLFSCVVHGFRGDGEAAMASADRAIELSPLDPLRHYYDALACSAALAARRLPRAVELAKRALRVNRDHLPTLRALTIAQVESGSLDEARQTAVRVLALEPSLTLRNYVARGPKGAETTRIRYAAALGEAGIPA